MKFNNLIDQIANDFIQHWNDRDMNKLASFLSNHIKLSSPKVKLLFPEAKDATLHTKTEVLKFWKQLNKEHYVYMKLIVLHKSSKVLKCEVDINSSNEKLFAVLKIDEYGKFIEMEMDYVALNN